MTSVGERIRLLRKELRLSQEKFAERLGKGIATIKRWESGETVPNDKTLRLIAHLFGVSYEWLREGRGEMWERKEAEDVKDRLKTLRRKLGLSQSQFAQKLGVSKDLISKYEQGRRQPPDRILRFICRMFGVSYEWLKEGKGEMLEPQTEEELVLWVVKKTMEVAKETRVKLSPSEVFEVARIAFNRLSKDLKNSGLSEEECKKRIKTVINFLKNASC